MEFGFILFRFRMDEHLNKWIKVSIDACYLLFIYSFLLQPFVRTISIISEKLIGIQLETIKFDQTREREREKSDTQNWWTQSFQFYVEIPFPLVAAIYFIFLSLEYWYGMHCYTHQFTLAAAAAAIDAQHIIHVSASIC